MRTFDDPIPRSIRTLSKLILKVASLDEVGSAGRKQATDDETGGEPEVVARRRYVTGLDRKDIAGAPKQMFPWLELYMRATRERAKRRCVMTPARLDYVFSGDRSSVEEGRVRVIELDLQYEPIGIRFSCVPIGRLIEGKPVMGATISHCVHNRTSTCCCVNIASSLWMARSRFTSASRYSGSMNLPDVLFWACKRSGCPYFRACSA